MKKHWFNKKVFISILVVGFIVGFAYGIFSSKDNELGLFLRKNNILIMITLSMLSGLILMSSALIRLKRNKDDYE